MNMDEAARAALKMNAGTGTWLVRSLSGVEEIAEGTLEIHGDLGLLTVTQDFEVVLGMNLGALETFVPWAEEEDE